MPSPEITPIAWISLVFAAVMAASAFYFRSRLNAVLRTVQFSKDRAREARDQVQSSEEKEKRLWAVLESMVEAVVVIDADQKIRLLNPALSRSFDFDKDAILGLRYWEVFRDSELNEMIERCLLDRAPLKKEHTLLLSDRVFEIQVSPVVSSSEFLGVVAVFHDVTQLKALENVRSEFVANVSHELKTPLTSIMGFIETLREGAAEDPKDRTRFLEIIDEHSKSLYGLIEGLLLLSKIESGREEMKKEALDFGKFTAKILEGFETHLRKGNLKASFKASSDPFWLYADKKTIQQAFTNLIDNAIKYTPPGGQIAVEASLEGAWSVIRIKDSGVGIPESDLKRVFERFYRVDKSRSRDSGGAGLGLAIVKHIVERHGGTVEAESRGQKGSIFTVRLPARQ